MFIFGHRNNSGNKPWGPNPKTKIIDLKIYCRGVRNRKNGQPARSYQE